jgi:hypothetical protein
MGNLWDDIAKTIKEGVDTVVEKTEELTKIGKIKVDIINIKRNVEKNFSELGGRVYHIIAEEKKTQISSDKEVKEIIDCIKILENELAEKKEELQNIRSHERAEPEPAAEKAPEAVDKPKEKKSAGGTKTAKKSDE